MIGSRSCKALAAALVGGLSCSILLAVPGKVVTKQGDTFEGEVQDRRADQGVVIITTADGRKVQVKAGNVDRIQPLARPEGAPDEAPGAPPGFDVPPTPAPRAAPGTQPGDRGSAPPPGMIPPLTADDINRIRQREWVRNDKLVKIRFVGDVKRRFVQKKRIAPADFNNRSAIEQAWQIVSEGDDDMRNDVRLTTDPAALHQYRTVVQRAILPTCASAACHGGGQGGGLQLYPRADHEGEAYANFVMLSTHSYSP